MGVYSEGFYEDYSALDNKKEAGRVETTCMQLLV